MESVSVCCFTGHRYIPQEHIEGISNAVSTVIDKLISQGVSEFRSGGAIGFDTVAALCVLDKKAKHPHISLHLFLPCKNQQNGWDDFNRQIYEYILEGADRVSYAAEEYFQGCMHERDRRLVSDTDVCVAYCINDEGGSAYTFEYARSQGVKAINVAEML